MYWKKAESSNYSVFILNMKIMYLGLVSCPTHKDHSTFRVIQIILKTNRKTNPKWKVKIQIFTTTLIEIHSVSYLLLHVGHRNNMIYIHKPFFVVWACEYLADPQNFCMWYNFQSKPTLHLAHHFHQVLQWEGCHVLPEVHYICAPHGSNPDLVHKMSVFVEWCVQLPQWGQYLHPE